MHNCLTVDVEEWFHVCGVDGALAPERWDELPGRVVANTHDLLNLLERCRVRATFFVLGWVAARHPRLIEEIVEAGHEIGSHGHSHRRVYDLSPESFEEELDLSRTALRAAGAPSIIGFRAPEWSINDRSLWALDVLARKGFRFDSSMAPLRIIGSPRYPQEPHPVMTASGQLIEFPPLVGRRFGQNVPLGGGWGLRMADPDCVVAEIEHRNSGGIPAALFVHPWEIDPDPPRMRLPRAKRFVHYFRLGGFSGRLERVLRALTFAPMGEVLGLSPQALA
jgi:polysaccharide deacetylase family protein (PEP-CTERM system associated)